VAGQWHLDAETYLRMVRSEIPSYDELQDRLADATTGVNAHAILDLGSGTGITAHRVIGRHPGCSVVGIDSSADMVELAKETVSSGRFICQRLEEPLPEGPFDVAVSAFAIHHLAGPGKRDLFSRVAAALRPGGRFVLLDVVVPTTPVSAPIPIEAGVDLPDTVDAQLRWLTDAGFSASVVFAAADVAILRADLD